MLLLKSPVLMYLYSKERAVTRKYTCCHSNRLQTSSKLHSNVDKLVLRSPKCWVVKLPFLEEQSSLTVTGTKLASSCQDTMPLWQIRHVPTRCGTNSSHVILECPHSQLFKFRLWAVFPKEEEQRKSLFFSDIGVVSLLGYRKKQHFIMSQ